MNTSGYEQVLFGILIAVAVYHLALFIMIKRDPSNLFLSLFCFVVSLRFQQTAFILQTSILYFSFPFLLLFLKTIFKDIVSEKPLYFFMALSTVIGTFPFVVKTGTLTGLYLFFTLLKVSLFIYIIYILAIACLNKRDGAVILSTAAVFCAFSVINDQINLIKTSFSSIGIFVLVLSQTVILIRKFSKNCSDSGLVFSDLESQKKLSYKFLQTRLDEAFLPLNGVIHISESMINGAGGPLTKLQKSNLSIIYAGGRNLVSLINEIADYIKLDNNDLVLNIRPVCLKEIVQSVFSIFRLQIIGKSLELKNNIDDDYLLVEADKNRLLQIFYIFIGSIINKLVVNCSINISASKNETGMVEIFVLGTSHIDETVLVDNGIYNARLALANSLIDLHGGSLHKLFGPQNTIKFIFTLPISKILRFSIDTKYKTGPFEPGPEEAGDLPVPEKGKEKDSGQEDIVSCLHHLVMQLKESNEILENKVRERTSALEQSNKRLEDTNNDLSKLQKSRLDLLSNISHDLKTPMTSIQGYVDAILDGIVTEPQKQEQYLRRIQVKIGGLIKLTQELFELTQLESRNITLNLQNIPVDSILRQIYDKYNLDIESAGIKINTDIPALAVFPCVMVDIDRIERVFSNLIFNAIKFKGAENSTIVIGFDVSANEVTFKVKDNGIGIAEQDIYHIFDRFYMGSKARTSSSDGHGLGLAIAKEIVEYHGGRIWVESKLGQGSTFYIALPIVK